MADDPISINKDSAEEWSTRPPDFQHNLDIDQSEKRILKKDKEPVCEQKNPTAADLTMDFLQENEKKNQIRNIAIRDYFIMGDHVVYNINVHLKERSWTVSRRYREFHSLHEQLVQIHGLAWELLPPKKIVGNLKSNHLEKRKVALEKYLKNVISVFGDLPRSLVRFLEIDQFDVHSVCQQLARDMYEIGDDLLAKQLIFKISPLQIHCIHRRLQLPLLTCESTNPADDIGHLYSFIQQIPRVLIFPGCQKDFIGDQELTYDLSIFRSLTYLEGDIAELISTLIRQNFAGFRQLIPKTGKVDTKLIQCCDLEFLEGIELIQKHVVEVRVHKSLQLIKDFLIGSRYWEQGILMTVTSDGPDDISKRFPSWNECKRASFSYNDIRTIDYSITLLPNVECLDLSHNLITEVEFLEQLTFMTDLNLSYNELRYLAEFPYKIPSISCLNLAGNGIQNIEGLDKLYCLEKLNICNNRIKRVRDVLTLGNLPLLRRLRVQGNPFAVTGNYRVRILGQFGNRAAEVVLDGTPTSNREIANVHEIIAAQNSYEVIDDEKTIRRDNIKPPKEGIAPINDKQSALAPTVPENAKPVASPTTKRRERIAQISNVTGKKDNEDNNLHTLEVEDEEFRQKIEKLREHAGESWLTVYNEMVDDRPPGNQEHLSPSTSTNIQKKKASKKIKNNKEVVKTLVEEKPLEDENLKRPRKPTFVSPLTVESIDLELSDELREEIKSLIKNDFSVFEETYLASVGNDQQDDKKEYLVAVDLEENLLSRIDFETGTTIQSYHLDSIRGVIVDEEPACITMLKFEAILQKAEKQEADTSHSLVKLKTRTLTDAAGLYLVLKSCSESFRRSTFAKSISVQEVNPGLFDNPYKIPNTLLMKFLQTFVRKTNSASKKQEPTSARNPTQQHTNYENVNIGLSFLKHADADNAPQNILSVLWVGCLPYLFPDEEIPVCMVTTSLNIFLFRIFHDEDELSTNKSQSAAALTNMTALQEALHCFYSFPLKSLREVVVGLFDQGIRLEVQEEGPRGTFVLLTRDANKTGQFLDILTTVVPVKTGRAELGSPEEPGAPDSRVNIVYPDESKINALKAQLQEQEISPIGSRENVISYCIVYQIRENEKRMDDYDDVYSLYLRSMILTNMRIFLCDEDYVHWPLPSYIHSAPFTPQWIVDDINNVESVIGVDVWEDSRQSMAGSYGLSLTFEGNTEETLSPDSEQSSVHVWNILFNSLAEREQLVRSLASIWKNSFGQDLKVTKSNSRTQKDATMPFPKGHAKKPSGNIVIPANQSLDHPDMFTSIDRARLNELFRNNIAQGDDVTVTGVQYVACAGCMPYKYPDVELPIAVLLGKYNIYLICTAKDRKSLLADMHFKDQGSSTSLYFTSIKITDLQQVVVGLFDQCIRLETGFPEATFVIVTRDFDHTNDLIQRLSQAILALPKRMNVIEGGADEAASRRTVAEIFQLYKQENDDEYSTSYYPKSEFIHPNSNIKFVYPSDELLEKLRVKIYDFIHIMDLFPTENDFGILLYALIFQTRDTVDIPYTLVVSETFICLIDEDHVSYPLPLFVKELPERTQYELSDVRLISSLLRVEFTDFHSGDLTLIFNAASVNPAKYDDRFKMGSVEDGSMCYVTDVNALPTNTEPSTKSKDDEENFTRWEVKAHSYAEREKILNILSKMWSSIFSGRTLPVSRAKK